MKKLWLFLLMLGISAGAFAQQGLYLGGKLIPQYALQVGSNDNYPGVDQIKMAPTYSAAVAFKAGYNFIPPMGVHTDVIYSRQRLMHTSVDTFSETSTMTRELNYLKIPIYFHINSVPKPVMFSWEFGPYMAFLLDANHTYDGPGFDSTAALDVYADDKSFYRGADFGISTNFGWDFFLSDHLFMIFHFRVDYGFLEVENKKLATNGNQFYSPFRNKFSNLTGGVEIGLQYMQHTDKCKPY